MKSNAKFFSGLALGLLISFIFLNVNMLKSEKPIESATPVVQDATTEENETNGTMVPTAEAEALISAYKNYTTAPGAKMVTEGGVIDRKVLKDILGMSSDDQIKFRFYKKDENIGIVFYPKRTSSSVLRTGFTSFCPNMCN